MYSGTVTIRVLGNFGIYTFISLNVITNTILTVDGFKRFIYTNICSVVEEPQPEPEPEPQFTIEYSAINNFYYGQTSIDSDYVLTDELNDKLDDEHDKAFLKYNDIITDVHRTSTGEKLNYQINIIYTNLDDYSVMGYNRVVQYYDLSNNVIIDAYEYESVYYILNYNIKQIIPINSNIYINTYYLKYNSILDEYKPDGNSLYYNLILHEIGHALGIGSVWFLQGVKQYYTDEYTGITMNYYIGENAVREYRNYANNQNLVGIPIEDNGDIGLANVHPEEGDQGNIFI